MIVCCFDVALQLVLRLVQYLLLLVRHAHYCCPYLSTLTLKTMICLKGLVFSLFACVSAVARHKQKHIFAPAFSMLEKKLPPAGGNPPVLTPVKAACSHLPGGDVIDAAANAVERQHM